MGDGLWIWTQHVDRTIIPSAENTQESAKSRRGGRQQPHRRNNGAASPNPFVLSAPSPLNELCEIANWKSSGYP